MPDPRLSLPDQYSGNHRVKRSDAAAETALQIERFYSKQILNGTLPPGSRIPPNNQLTQIWETSNATVQRALAKLSSEGLIERQQGRGTFVRDKTQQSFIGVFLGPNLEADSVGFYRSLAARIREMAETDYRSIRVYDGLTKPLKTALGKLLKPDGSGSKAKNSLEGFKLDARHLAFDGYIYLATSNMVENPLIQDRHPRVTFHDERLGDDVILDSVAFLNETLTELVARGFRKVAFLQAYGQRTPLTADLLSAEQCQAIASRFPIKEFQFWDFPVQVFYESHADKILREGYLDAKVRKGLPEVIIISDDIIARPVIFNCVRRNIRIPEDMQVCVRCNDSQSLYYGEPVFRYELPIRTIADSLISLLKQRMANEPMPQLPLKVTGRFREP